MNDLSVPFLFSLEPCECNEKAKKPTFLIHCFAICQKERLKSSRVQLRCLLLNLEGGDDEEELNEGSESDSATTIPQPLEVMISCIQTTSGGCLLISSVLIP